VEFPSQRAETPEETRPEPESFPPSSSEPEEEREAGDEEEARREEVRRSVDLARAELAAGPLHLVGFEPATLGGWEVEQASPEVADTPIEAEHPEVVAGTEPRSLAWQPPVISEVDLRPPSLVIEDTDGRVELARVYEALDRLDCAAQATLLNYTPHSVTVGLASREAVPPRDAIADVIREVFGRSCQVADEGMRIAVKIDGGKGSLLR
jgi:hypothetical protein